MKIRYAAIMFFLALILQGTFLNLISIFGITPNLILCLIAAFSFIYGEYKIAIIGIAFGLLLDVNTGIYLGVSSFSFFTVSFMIILLRESINRDNPASAIIIGIVATTVSNGIHYFVNRCFGVSQSFFYWAQLQPFYIVYNCIVIFILYLILIKKVTKHRNDRYLAWKDF